MPWPKNKKRALPTEKYTLKVRVREMDGWACGAEVNVAIDPARVLVFPRDSQESEDFLVC